ncbi:MAG: hypothetical protein H8F28_00795 [Fibrella sp.]|nr:hypothetical protein [Armatimonadota bacterium]
MDEYQDPPFFAHAVLKRPCMYTVNGTYGEIIAFLTGYYSGGSHPPPPKWAEATSWGRFNSWLAEKLQSDHNNPHRVIAGRYGDKTLEHFEDYFSEWWLSEYSMTPDAHATKLHSESQVYINRMKAL